MDASRPRVVFLGAANVDSFYRVDALPTPGETVLGSGPVTAVGGKGANQAIAAARTGVAVKFLGAVGGDGAGKRIVRTLENAGVDVHRLITLENEPTGRAVILVDAQGQNEIIVSPAANGRLTVGHVERFAGAIGEAAVLVVQGEIPTAVTVAAIGVAGRAGVRVVLNLAPYVDLGPAIACADPLVLNEVEATQLLGRPVTGVESSDAVAELTRFARSGVVTIGAAGALVVDDSGVAHIPAPAPRHLVDTTGAGDAFVGVLAAALAGGAALRESAASAVYAATESVAVLGAGESYPEFALDRPSKVVAG
jgi:ribokinase